MDGCGAQKENHERRLVHIQYIRDVARSRKIGGCVVTVIPTRRPRRHLSTRRSHVARIIEDEGQKYRIGLGRFPDGAPAEVFVDVVGKAGSAIQMHVETAAILVSLLLQHGVPFTTIKHSIAGPVAAALDLFSDDDGGTP